MDRIKVKKNPDGSIKEGVTVIPSKSSKLSKQPSEEDSEPEDLHNAEDEFISNSKSRIRKSSDSIANKTEIVKSSKSEDVPAKESKSSRFMSSESDEEREVKSVSLVSREKHHSTYTLKILHDLSERVDIRKIGGFCVSFSTYNQENPRNFIKTCLLSHLNGVFSIEFLFKKKRFKEAYVTAIGPPDSIPESFVTTFTSTHIELDEKYTRKGSVFTISIKW